MDSAGSDADTGTASCATLHWSLVSLIFSLLREALADNSWHSGWSWSLPQTLLIQQRPDSFCWIVPTLLFGDTFELDCCYPDTTELGGWYPDNGDWNCPRESLLNKFPFPFLFTFCLPLDGGLEKGSKCWRALIKEGCKKSKPTGRHLYAWHIMNFFIS